MTTDSNTNLFAPLVHSWLIALKNYILYPPEHPVNSFAVSRLKNMLKKWFTINDILDLGFAPEKLFLNGSSCPDMDARMKDLAKFFHIRGALSMKIQSDIDNRELAELLHILSSNSRALLNEGLAARTAHLQNVSIKEIDLSSVVETEISEMGSHFMHIWEHLLSEKSTAAILPEDKISLFVKCFEENEKAGRLIQNLYKTAMQTQRNETLFQILRCNLFQTIKTLDEQSVAETPKNFRQNCLAVLSDQPVDLIETLFSDFKYNDEYVNLANQLIEDIPDSFVIDFLESMILGEETLNESLLKIFDKLVPADDSADRIVPLLSERLFEKQWISTKNLTKMQLAVQELFKENKDSSFLEKCYQITVDSVLNHKLDGLLYIPKLHALIQEFIWSVEEDHLTGETTYLILNILKDETEPESFNLLFEPLIERIPVLYKKRHFKAIRDVVTFLYTDIPEDQARHSQISAYRKWAKEKLHQMELAEKIVSCIISANSSDFFILQEICNTLGKNTAGILLNAAINENDNEKRAKLLKALEPVKQEASKQIINIFKTCEPLHIKRLFQIAKIISPGRIQEAVRLIIAQNNQLKLWEALDFAKPLNEQETREWFRAFKQTNHPEFKVKWAKALLRADDNQITEKIFKALKINKKINPYCPKLSVFQENGSFCHLLTIF